MVLFILDDDDDDNDNDADADTDAGVCRGVITATDGDNDDVEEIAVSGQCWC